MKRNYGNHMEPKNGVYVHKDGSLRWYKNNLLHKEDGPAVEYDYTNPVPAHLPQRNPQYWIDGVQIVNWDDPNPKVQELKAYKDADHVLKE